VSPSIEPAFSIWTTLKEAIALKSGVQPLFCVIRGLKAASELSFIYAPYLQLGDRHPSQFF
jgi:hypothetical protein